MTTDKKINDLIFREKSKNNKEDKDNKLFKDFVICN